MTARPTRRCAGRRESRFTHVSISAMNAFCLHRKGIPTSIPRIRSRDSAAFRYVVSKTTFLPERKAAPARPAICKNTASRISSENRNPNISSRMSSDDNTTTSSFSRSLRAKVDFPLAGSPNRINTYGCGSSTFLRIILHSRTAQVLFMNSLSCLIHNLSLDYQLTILFTLYKELRCALSARFSSLPIAK